MLTNVCFMLGNGSRLQTVLLCPCVRALTQLASQQAVSNKTAHHLLKHFLSISCLTSINLATITLPAALEWQILPIWLLLPAQVDMMIMPPVCSICSH